MKKATLQYEVDFRPSVKVGHAPHDARLIQAELRRVENANGVLRPGDVVERASSPDNPLHRYFEWSDTKAARAYRLVQARALIASVQVRVVSEPERPPYRAFLNVPEEEAQEQYYGSTEKVLGDPQQRARILARASAELEGFERRYAQLEELAEVFAAARRLRQTVAS